MRFVSLVSGLIGKARRSVSQAASVHLSPATTDKDSLPSPAEVARALRETMQRVNILEARLSAEPIEFEVVVGINGATTEMYHGFSSPVRWSVVEWLGVNGSPTPVKAPQLVRSTTGDTNRLVLASYVAGRAVIRVEPSAYEIDPGVVVAGVAANGADSAVISGLRVSVTNGVPVDPSNNSGSGTVYLTPFVSGQIRLYYGGEWITRTTAQVSVAVPATTSTNYDVFAFWTGSAVGIELLAWASSGGGTSTRATALTTQDGVKVKTGDPTRLYVGTVRTGQVSGNVPDTTSFRFVWNQYNRIQRDFSFHDASGSWTYVNPNGVWRQMHATAADCCQVVVGDVTPVYAEGQLGCSTTAATGFSCGLGVNSTTVNSATVFGNWVNGSGQLAVATFSYSGSLSAGFHSLNMLETGQSNALTYTFQNGGITWAGGMVGGFWA